MAEAIPKEIQGDVYDFSVLTPDGREVSLSKYRGNVLVVVNTASKCGFTPQYAGLEALYKLYAGRGLQILGFPCNQFGGQEPGTAEEISRFCELNYGVSFPIFAKIEVNGTNAHPLFKFLKSEKSGLLGALGLQAIPWNFTKFLIDREGKVVKRFAPATAPAELATAIEKLL